jgi:hypothetical protein
VGSGQKGDYFMPITVTNSTVENINVYRVAKKDESFTEGSQAKFAPSQKDAIQKICREHGFSVSEFLRDAVDVYIDLFPYKTKIEEHRRLLRLFLHKLK